MTDYHAGTKLVDMETNTMKKDFLIITAANYNHYNYVYKLLRDGGMTKDKVSDAMNVSHQNADRFEYDYTNGTQKGLTRR